MKRSPVKAADAQCLHAARNAYTLLTLFAFQIIMFLEMLLQVFSGFSTGKAGCLYAIFAPYTATPLSEQIWLVINTLAPTGTFVSTLILELN